MVPKEGRRELNAFGLRYHVASHAMCDCATPFSSCFCRVIFLLVVNGKLCSVTHNACGGVYTGLKLGL